MYFSLTSTHTEDFIHQIMKQILPLIVCCLTFLLFDRFNGVLSIQKEGIYTWYGKIDMPSLWEDPWTFSNVSMLLKNISNTIDRCNSQDRFFLDRKLFALMEKFAPKDTSIFFPSPASVLFEKNENIGEKVAEHIKHLDNSVSCIVIKAHNHQTLDYNRFGQIRTLLNPEYMLDYTFEGKVYHVIDTTVIQFTMLPKMMDSNDVRGELFYKRQMMVVNIGVISPV